VVHCLAILAVALLQQAGVSAPRIDVRGTEAVLLLPPAMADALKKFDPDFQPRRVADYPAWIMRDWYKLTPQQAPFAVVGDFNGDKVLDAVVDGDNRDRGRRLAILSGTDGFQVSELNTEQHVSQQLEGRGPRGIAPGSRRDGLDSGLRLVPTRNRAIAS
jgi:hypothetical protein